MADDTRSQLLETLAARAVGGGGINAQELLLAQLGGAEDVDPSVNLIARYLVNSQSPDDEKPEEEDDEAPPEPSEGDRARAEERARSFERLRRVMEEMYEELEALRERNDTLAAALGACYLCWGEDYECPVCGGAGHPGSSMPDSALLAQLVAPAVRRLRQRGGHDGRASPGTDARA